MRIATVTLSGSSQYSASAPISEPKKDKELADAYEERTWRNRLNVTQDGHGCIPAMAFSKTVVAAAKLRKDKIKGKGNQEWTKHFQGGVLVTEPLILPVNRTTVQGEKLFVPSDGVPGGGSRVWKIFPVVPTWAGDVKFYVLNDTITEEIFEAYIKEAGNLVGVGRFRPERGGYYGRFDVKSIDWETR